MRILFILKERFYGHTNIKSYGLINSALHVAKHLHTLEIDAKVVTVIDANGIDKEVFLFKPDFVFIEALWVTGEKLKELIEIKRYKKIQWIVRIHSDIGFLGAETFALKYINDYIALNKSNLTIAPNNQEFTNYLSNALHYKFKYLPNIIEIKEKKCCEINKNSKIIHIGCFGALRILKNQLFQALCAMKTADILGKTLYFHINADTKSDDKILNPIQKNFEELFAKSKHVLIEHPWEENHEFQHLIRRMDIGLQLSYSESFNIITTDFINNDKLILVGEAIDWMPDISKASTHNYDDVTKKIIYFYNHRNSCRLKGKMRKYLIKYNIKAKIIWFDFLIMHKY